MVTEKKFEGAYNDEKKYLHVTVYKIDSADDAHGMWKMIIKELEGKTNREVLVDLSPNKQTSVALSARKAFREYEDFFTTISKVAFIAENPIIRMLVKTTMTVIDKNKVSKYFKTVSEGLEWLKEGN
ncbi:hypothetical protein GX441_09880 [bacterium]|nr:hypothetical protein [bacterium]